MGLYCSCDYEPDPGDTVYYGPEDYTALATKRSRKCLSCRNTILVGSVCAKVPRFKIPSYDIECRIYGEDGEIPCAPAYLCERCADLCFSLMELGYCPAPWKDQRDLVAEYVDMHTSTKQVYESDSV